MPDTPWDKARGHVLSRANGYPKPEIDKLDRGVNYFVLMLEKLGCRTHWSCEGHPNGFYIVFTAPYSTAMMVKSPGYFSVEIEGKNRWSLRINHPFGSDRERRRCLRWAAAAWEKAFNKEGA